MTVELLVTIIVGAILILSLNSIVVSHSFLTQRSRNLVMANAFAEQKVEALRSRGYLAVSSGSTNITAELPDDLKRPRSATQNVTNYSSGIKRIHLSITYNEQGKPRTQSYVTYLGELGVGQY